MIKFIIAQISFNLLFIAQSIHDIFNGVAVTDYQHIFLFF
jgi:hypothetical protein